MKIIEVFIEVFITLSIIIFAAQGVTRLITGKSPNDPITSHSQGWFYIWVFSCSFTGVALLIFGELGKGWPLLIYIGVTIPVFAVLGEFTPRLASFIVKDKKKTALRGSISFLIFLVSFLSVVIILGKVLAKYK